MNTELKNHMIDLYRESINKRYTFENIKKDPNLPKSFTKQTVDELRDFFLENLYSSPSEREKLDKAFLQLESYVSHPSKVFGLLGNLASAVFEFGFHLPQAIHTGSVTLRTHSLLARFENDLLAIAESKNFPIPFTEEQFNECLAELCRTSKSSSSLLNLPIYLNLFPIPLYSIKPFLFLEECFQK
jgi:hypothetical protein